MGLHINNPDVERKVRSLAEALGTTLTEAIEISVTKELRRAVPRKPDPHFIQDILKILDRVDRLPVLDTRSAEEILGYNEHGAFD